MRIVSRKWTIEERADGGSVIRNIESPEHGFLLDKPLTRALSVIRNNPETGPDGLPLSPVMARAFLRTLERLEILGKDQSMDGNTFLEIPVNPPFISVVILNYNGEPHLRDCLDSIIGQSYPNHEIIVVDNASKDSSLALLENEYGSKIRLVQLEKGVSFSEGNNIGIKEAKGEYVLIMNNDTRLHTRGFREISSCIQKNTSNWAALALKMHFFYTPGIINSFGNSMQRRNWGYDNYLGFIDFGQFDNVRDVMSACFGAVLIKKSVHEKIGGLDPEYWFYVEDVDWSIRAQMAGYGIETCPNAIVYHKFSASSDRKGQNFKIFLAIRNRMYLVLKNYAPYYAWKFFINYFLEDANNFLKSLQRKDFGLSWAYMRAYVEIIFRKLPVALFHRIKTPNLDQASKEKQQKIFSRARPHHSPVNFLEGNLVRLTVGTIRKWYLDAEKPQSDESIR